jgi:WD40 repeat protein
MHALSCDDARLRFSDLLAGLIEPADADALDAHLAGCPACRAAVRESARLDRALAEMAALAKIDQTKARLRAALATVAIEDLVPEPAAQRRWSFRLLRLAPLAAAILLIVGLVFLSVRPAPAIAQIAEVEGTVTVQSGRGQYLAAAGHSLRRGDRIQTADEDGRAVIVFPDQTRLEVGAGSTVNEITEAPDGDGGSGKRIFLTEGSISAVVTRQPPGRPMLLSTPHAQVVVQGTKVSLVHSSRATRIDLDEGAVKVTRQQDGKSVELAAGDYALVGPDVPAIAPRPMPPRIATPRASLPEPAGRVLALGFAPAGQTLAWGCSDGSVKFWPLPPEGHTSPSCLPGHMPTELRALAFSRTGSLLATGSDDYLVKLWDPATFQERRTLKVLRSWIEALAFSPDDATLVIAGAHGQESAKVRLYDMASEKVRATLNAHPGGTWAVAFSPDGKLLATVGRDGIARLWDPQTGQLLQSLTGHSGELLAVAFSPDGKLLATTSRDRTVKLWDVATGEEQATLIGHSHDVRAVAFSPDGTLLASGSMDGTIKLWDLADGQERATLRGQPGGGVWCVAFSPDGKTLASAGFSRAIRLWDVPAARP